MPRYERKGEFREVSLDGSTLVLISGKEGGWLRRKRTSETQKQTFGSSLEARLAFARTTRELREEGFVPVVDKKRKSKGTDAVALATRAKFESFLEIDIPEPLSADKAREALIGLYELRSALESAGRGDFFPESPRLLDGLDPEPRIRQWESAIVASYGGPLTPIQLQTRQQFESSLQGSAVPAAIDEYTASRALGALFELRTTLRRSADGEFFPDAPHLLSGLDPEPLIEHWRARLQDEHDDIGEVFFAEVAERSGFPISGVELREGRRRETFRAPPAPRSGRGFDRSGEEDETILALEEKLLENRDSLETYAVYADRLQELGNPLGELVALGLAAEESGDNSDVEQYVENNGTALLGPLAEISQDGVELTWRRGFVDSARFASQENDELDDGIEALLECPAGSFLRALTLGMMGDYELDYETTIDLLAESGPLRALEELFIGDFEYPDEIEMSWVIVGDVSPLWKALPNLRELTLQGGEIELGTIEAPELQRLSLRSGGLPREVLQSIEEAEWPKLEELELWLGTDEYGGDADIDDLGGMLTRAKMPKLETLRLMNSELSDEIAVALRSSELLPQLKTVDLSMGTLSLEGAQAIANTLDRFAHLETLDLSDNFLEDDAVALLSEHSFIEFGAQKEADEDDGEVWRYVSVGE